MTKYYLQDGKVGHYEVLPRFGYSVGGQLVDFSGGAPTFQSLSHVPGTPGIMNHYFVIFVEDKPRDDKAPSDSRTQGTLLTDIGEGGRIR